MLYYKIQLLAVPDATWQLVTEQLYRIGQFPSRNYTRIYSKQLRFSELLVVMDTFPKKQLPAAALDS